MMSGKLTDLGQHTQISALIHKRPQIAIPINVI
jgi:hypothetical protein